MMVAVVGVGWRIEYIYTCPRNLVQRGVFVESGILLSEL